VAFAVDAELYPGNYSVVVFQSHSYTVHQSVQIIPFLVCRVWRIVQAPPAHLQTRESLEPQFAWLKVISEHPNRAGVLESDAAANI
jgi:hypothetical protein